MGAWIDSWWAGLLGASVELALVALLVGACLWLTRRWAPAVRWSIAAVVLVKMALPTLAAPTSLMRLSVPEARTASLGPLPLPVARELAPTPAPTAAVRSSAPAREGAPARPRGAEASGLTTAQLAFAGYALGVLAVLGLGLVDMARFWRRAATARPVDRDFEAVWQGIGGRGAAPRVLRSAQVARPICFGVLRPTVLLPAAAAAPGTEQLMVAHEFGHLHHRDGLRNLVHWLLAACWWFHPAAWWVGRQLRRLQEDRCDDAVLGWSADPVAYGDTLLSAVRHEHEGRGPSLALGMAREHGLAGRLRRIFDPSLSRRTRLMQRLIPCLLVLAAAAAPTDVRSQRASDGGAVRADDFGGAQASPQDPAGRAIGSAMAWLAAAQREDGSFAKGGPGSAALAALAFLGSGQTANVGPQKQAVERAMGHLQEVLASDASEPQERAMAAAAVSEHGVLVGSPGLTQAQLDTLAERARSEAVGPREAYWLGYSLISASHGGQPLDDAALAAVRAHLPLGHAAPDRGWSAETTCAASIMLHLLAGGSDDAEGFDRAVERVLGAAARDLRNDPALVQFGSLAMFQVGGSAWRAWMAGIRPQMKLGEDGSVATGDRVASTAFMTLAMATTFRYARLVR